MAILGGVDAAPIIISSAALIVSLGALTINLREHREFMRQLKARARFTVTVETVDADDDGILWTDADRKPQLPPQLRDGHGPRCGPQNAVNSGFWHWPETW
jgi:hypothetical protein